MTSVPAIQTRAFSKENGLQLCFHCLALEASVLVDVVLGVFQRFQEWNKAVYWPSPLLVVDDRCLRSTEVYVKVEETKASSCDILTTFHQHTHHTQVESVTPLLLLGFHIHAAAAGHTC